MLEKVIKIITTINSCKRLPQLEQCLIMIENFERDEKPLDERIVGGLMQIYREHEDKLIRISHLKLNSMKDIKINPLIDYMGFTTWNYKEISKEKFDSLKLIISGIKVEYEDLEHIGNGEYQFKIRSESY